MPDSFAEKTIAIASVTWLLFVTVPVAEPIRPIGVALSVSAIVGAGFVRRAPGYLREVYGRVARTVLPLVLIAVCIVVGLVVGHRGTEPVTPALIAGSLVGLG